MVEQRFRVDGMTCQHCVQAVTTALSGLPGVRSVDIDLASGDVGVTSDVPVEDDMIAEAIEHAGYRVSS
ncbi:MAG: heavy-metal-associated domain-containing protein [Acidimicrobiia bacterium]